MMFAFVAKHRGIWPVALICEALGVSRSGFYGWLTRPPSDRARRHEMMTALDFLQHAEHVSRLQLANRAAADIRIDVLSEDPFLLSNRDIGKLLLFRVSDHLLGNVLEGRRRLLLGLLLALLLS